MKKNLRMSLLISVCMITYNHEPFIAQAIESVMMQNVEFDIELIIGDDFSTDNTLLVIEEKKKKYGDKIKILKSDKNIGIQPNFIRVYKACVGQYIAMLEGDDYWTDEKKLQKQISFLEENKDYSICYHKVSVVQNDSGQILQYLPNMPKDTSTLVDLSERNLITTLSCVFRNNMHGILPDWFHDAPVGDYCLHMLNARFGKIKYIPDNMGVYRKHNQISWSNLGLVTRWGQLFYSIQLLKQEFTGEIAHLLSMQQFFILDAAMSALNQDDYIVFKDKYRNEIADLALVTSGRIYSNHVNLKSLGARIGMKIAKTMRKFI